MSAALLNQAIDMELDVPVGALLPRGWSRLPCGDVVPPLSASPDSESSEDEDGPAAAGIAVARRAHPGQQFIDREANATARARFLKRKLEAPAPLAAHVRAAALLDATAQHAERESVPPKEASGRDARLRFIHMGSSKPHDALGDAVGLQRVDRWAPTGSLRQLEPELHSVLEVEPMPRCNIPPRTDPEDPPERMANVPGPFTTAQLIPEPVVRRVTHHGTLIVDLFRRARKGPRGAQLARRLRPEAIVIHEAEGVYPCGRGWVWRKDPDQDLWHAVQPSSWPHHPPDSSFKGDVFEADAKAHGLTDEQVVSWGLHGYPGSRTLPIWPAVIGYPHAGAIKNAEAMQEMNQRDIANGFVSHGHAFPEFWPCRVDPMNIVVQHGKPRATIDKTMRLSSTAHPEAVESYNDHIDLTEERKRCPFKLVRVWQLTRAAAILATAGVTIELGKFDLSTYFRIHGKQMVHVHQSGRVLDTAYGFDFRVNFGERDAPDHTGRASDALAFFVRTELRRLAREYPSRCPRIIKWLAMRLGLARDASDLEDPAFLWSVTFFFLYYVDDAGLAAFADLLVDSSGRPVMLSITDGKGKVSTRQQRRSELYFEAATAIVQRYGHLTPDKKKSPMGPTLEFLGIDCVVTAMMRMLSRDKRRDYGAALETAISTAKLMPNGVLAAAYDGVNSLLHKLLSASEVIPLGRPHLFYLRKAIKGAENNKLEFHAVLLTQDVIKELEWWRAQLAKSHEHGIPFACRFSFPTSSDSTIIYYGDASREINDPAASGWGAWSVIDGTFVYVEGRWSPEEIARFSINVLETQVKDMAGKRFLQYARAQSLEPTHVMAFVDNSTAEAIAEFGRASTAGLNFLNLRRQEWLVAEGVVQATERVASVDNDIADDLSRGAIEEALRFPADADLPILRLHVEPADRSMADVPPTWGLA